MSTPWPRTKTVIPEALVALGAEALAEVLITHAATDPTLCKKPGMLLAGTEGLGVALSFGSIISPSSLISAVWNENSMYEYSHIPPHKMRTFRHQDRTTIRAVSALTTGQNRTEDSGLIWTENKLA